MALRDWVRGILNVPAQPAPARSEPNVATPMAAGGGITITTAAELEAALRSGAETLSGAVVNADSAMRVAAVYACVRLLSSAVATMPIDTMRWLGPNERAEARNHPLWKVLRRRPNRWQTPSQFKRMLEAHKQLRGNGYAYIVWSMGRVLELIPMHPDRTTPMRQPDLSIKYRYINEQGIARIFDQHEVFHLVGMSLDGWRGVSPLTYARETVGMSLSMEQHGANMFRNGTQIGSVFKLPKGSNLNDAEFRRLKASLDEYKSNGDKAGGTLLLEDGLDIDTMGMTAADAQWVESRKLSRSDIAMFFGVPPHMIGDTDRSTSWGTGIDSQTQGFVAFVLEDHLVGWEETCERDLLLETETDIYLKFDRDALVRGDMKARQAYYQSGLQWGWLNPDEVRAKEDMNPRADGKGDKYYDPPNTAGSATKKGPADDPQVDA